jgi:hypothetical protein
MDHDWTLPTLQHWLDQLGPDAILPLKRSQVERLFGLNDVAQARLLRLAQGHNCTISYSDGSVVLKKRHVTEGGPA